VRRPSGAFEISHTTENPHPLLITPVDQGRNIALAMPCSGAAAGNEIRVAFGFLNSDFVRISDFVLRIYRVTATARRLTLLACRCSKLKT
jgi:hypothetical protein